MPDPIVPEVRLWGDRSQSFNLELVMAERVFRKLANLS
jgi:hypothetical protein